MSTKPPEHVSVSITLRADTVRSDLKRGLVRFVNYAAVDPTAVKAEQLDLHGACMLPGDVEMFAHRWLRYSRSIDVQHNGVGVPVYPVESFFNSPDVASPLYPANSHVVLLDCAASPDVMEGLRTGKLNSVSLDAFTTHTYERLPVAKEVVAAMTMKSSELTDLQWAGELAAAGFDGVKSVRRAHKGLYLINRGELPPLSVVLDQKSDAFYDVEVIPPGMGAMLLEAPEFAFVSADDILKALLALGLQTTADELGKKIREVTQ